MSLTQTLLSHSLHEAFHRYLVVVIARAKHGPVDATNDVLDSPRSVACTEINILENDRKDFLVVAAGSVELVGAELGVEILAGDDCNESTALSQSSTCMWRTIE